jgi:hypothetical protein
MTNCHSESVKFQRVNGRKASCAYNAVSLLRQRIYALGYEDLKHHDVARNDPALQAASGRDQQLASASALCRFENETIFTVLSVSGYFSFGSIQAPRWAIQYLPF